MLRQTDLTHRLYAQLLEEDESSTNSPPPLPSARRSVQLQVELENGSRVSIRPSPEDSPLQLASTFCRQNNLHSDMISILADSIKKSMAYSQNSSTTPEQQLTTFPSEILLTDPSPYCCRMKEKAEGPLGLFNSENVVPQGVGLYEKGRLFEEQHRLWIQKQRKQKVKAESKECTHIPIINKMSRSIASQRSLSKASQCHSRVDSQQTSHKFKMRPSLSQVPMCYSVSNSMILVKQPKKDIPKEGRSCHLKQRDNNRSNVFLDLYENRKSDWTVKQDRPSHRPSINSVSRQIVGNTNFTQRMVKYEQVKQKKTKKVKAQQKVSKQNMYRPKVGAAPPTRNLDRLPIGDFLYQQRKKKTIVLARPPPTPSISQTSRQIYDKCRQLAFERLFIHLDVFQEGKVSWKGIDASKLDYSILVILQPVLEEIDIMQIELNLRDFKAALHSLFDTLTPIDKNMLLSFGNNKSEPLNDGTPVPEMNKKSRQLLQKMTRQDMSIYDFCEWKGCLREGQLENKRVQQERVQLQECSFRPKVKRKGLYF